MAKQEKLDFNYEEYFDEMFEDTAVLMWTTHHRAFTFAFFLNQLYNLDLELRDNIVLQYKKKEIGCTVYSSQNDVDHMAYFLIDNSEASLPTPKKTILFDKTLLIKGPGAQSKAEYIYSDLEQNSIADNNFVGQQRDELRNTFVNTGILESVLFDFSTPDEPDTTYFPNSQGDTEKEKKRQRFLKEHREYVADLFMALDSMMPDFE